MIPLRTPTGNKQMHFPGVESRLSANRRSFGNAKPNQFNYNSTNLKRIAQEVTETSKKKEQP